MELSEKSPFYDLTRYLVVYVLLKPSSELIGADAKRCVCSSVKYDRIKKKHYIRGSLVMHEIRNAFDRTPSFLPVQGSIAIVPYEHLINYKNRREKEKQNFVIQIPYKDIEYITIEFNTFS